MHPSSPAPVSHRRKKWTGFLLLVVFAVFSIVLFWFVGKPMLATLSQPEQSRAWVDAHGILGRLAMIGMMAFQIIVAIVPGEPLEIGAGYAFGAWEGTLLCLIGSVLGSLLVFCFVRKFGVKIVELFFPREKIQSISFLRKMCIRDSFSIEALGARVAAHLRREYRHKAAAHVRFDQDFAIDYSECTAYFQGTPLPLAKKEFEILAFLSQHSGQVFDKERIYEAVWGWDGQGDSAVVAEHIRRIRAKLNAAGVRPYIETVWGMGYKWAK